MKSNYKIQFVTDYAEWEAQFLSIAQTPLSQSWHYGDAKSKSENWTVTRGIIFENQKPIAMVQAWYRKKLFFKIVRISYGPLWLIDVPTHEQIENTLQIIKKCWNIKNRCILSIAPNLNQSCENKVLLKKLRFMKRRTAAYESGQVDLTQPIEQLRAKLRQNWRNQLTSSEKKNLTFHVSQTKSDFDWLIKNFETMRMEKNFYGHSISLLTALHHFSQTEIAFITQDDHRVAAMLIAHAGSTCVPLVIWVDKSGRSLNAGNFLLWNSLLHLKNNGKLWFDLGGTNNSSAFKTGLPHSPYQMVGEYIVL